MSTEDEKITNLYQQKNNQQPPAHLDATILNAAKEAASKTQINDNSNNPATSKGPFSGGWPAMASIAAVLIISVILIPLINQEAPQTSSSGFSGNEKRLLEQDDFEQEVTEQLNIMKAKQRAISKQKKSISEASYSLQAPVARSGKGQTFQDALAPTTMEPTKLKQEKNNRYYTLMPTLQEDETSMATGSIFTQDYSNTDNNLTPQDWLKNIQLLINQGNLILAKKKLVHFIEKYPDEKIEQSIIDSLKGTSIN